MSRINIQRTIENIRSKSNVYTPVIESVVNSIHAIRKKNIDNGKIEITLHRDNMIQFENAKSDVRSIHISDNGVGFDQDNRDSFDTFYSEFKKEELAERVLVGLCLLSILVMSVLKVSIVMMKTN